MVDYISVMLTGLFTGIGVIFSQKIWQKMEEHRLKLRERYNNLKNNIMMEDIW